MRDILFTVIALQIDIFLPFVWPFNFSSIHHPCIGGLRKQAVNFKQYVDRYAERIPLFNNLAIFVKFRNLFCIIPRSCCFSLLVGFFY